MSQTQLSGVVTSSCQFSQACSESRKDKIAPSLQSRGTWEQNSTLLVTHFELQTIRHTQSKRTSSAHQVHHPINTATDTTNAEYQRTTVKQVQSVQTKRCLKKEILKLCCLIFQVTQIAEVFVLIFTTFFRSKLRFAFSYGRSKGIFTIHPYPSKLFILNFDAQRDYHLMKGQRMHTVCNRQQLVLFAAW